MKNKSLFKRALSAVLCAVMLVSCWVFTAPSASAATATGPSSTYGNQEINSGTTELAGSLYGRYRVRLCIHEDDGFDQSLHDNDNYVPGIVYANTTAFTNTASKRNLTGTSRKNDLNASGQSNPNDKQNNGTSDYPYWCEYAQICYKNMNGTGDEGAVWFNMGDYDGNGRDSVISGGGYDYGYFPSENGVVINGFPTSFRVRYRDKAGADWFGANHGGFSVYLQVAVWDTTASTWTWSEGTCTGTPAVWGALGGGWDSAYAYGIAYGATGSIKNVDGGVDIPLGSTAIANTYYPQASTTRRTKTSNGVTAVTTAPTVSYGTSTIYCPKTSTATITTTNKSDLSFTSPKDQYGTYMAANITTELSRDDKSDTDFIQSGLTTAATYTANIAGTTSQQYVKPTVTWPQKTGTSLASTVTDDKRLKVYDAQYTVKFKDASGNTIQNGTSGDLTRTVYYGSNATAPAASTYAKAYDTTNHYTFNTWDPSNTNVTSDRTCVPQYNEIAHTMVKDDTLPGYQAATCTEAGTQTRKCSGCAYTDTIPINPSRHAFELTAVQPNDKVSGYTCYHCKNCDNYWNAPYNSGYTAPDLDSETGIADPGQLNNSDTIPAPYFNDFKEDYDGDGNADYAYGERGSGLKLMKNGGEFNAATTKQDFRFSGSVEIPKDISYEIGSRNDNVIKDFGFVYSQDSHIESDTSLLVLNSGDSKIATMSVVNNNAANGNVISVNDSTGRLNGENGEWSGVTFHSGDGSDEFLDSLTFNLVISIKATNWKMQYAARPYITYIYHGETYTVYDTGASAQGGQVLLPEYSCCSVYSLASFIAVWDSENAAAQYCTDNILAHEALLYPTTFADNKKSDEYTDWWKWVEGAADWTEFTTGENAFFYSDYCNFMNNHQ